MMTPRFDTWQDVAIFFFALISITIFILIIEDYDNIKAKHKLKKQEKEHQRIYYTILSQSIHRY